MTKRDAGPQGLATPQDAAATSGDVARAPAMGCVAEAMCEAYATAQGLLRGDDLNAPTLDRMRAMLAAAGPAEALWEICDSSADAMARVLGSPERLSHTVLTTGGWLIHDFGAVRPQHVYAVAVLLSVEACRHAEPTATHERAIRKLLQEALFMAGRHDMRMHVEKEEARLRSERAAAGGAPRQFSDERMLAERSAWLSAHGHERGWKKAAARALDVTDKAISLRWAAYCAKQEASE